MKKEFSLIFIVFSVLFAACSNSGSSSENAFDGENTLKRKVSARSENVVWTYEMEPEILTKDLSHTEGISDNVAKEPYIANLSVFQKEKIYPEIKDFGSLENESLKKSTYKLVSDFFSVFNSSANKASSETTTIYDGEKYIRKDSIFTYVFFLEDLKQYFAGKSFGTEISFYRFVIGKSYLSGKEVQVPVRLYVKDLKNYIDVNVYVDESENLISQIKIERIK